MDEEQDDFFCRDRQEPPDSINRRSIYIAILGVLGILALAVFSLLIL